MSLWKDKPTYEYRQLDPNNFASQGLVGCWLLNENVGATAYDLSGNNNHGTLTSMANPPTTISGWAGQGLAFDGVDDYIGVGDSALLNPTSEITLSAWINFTSFTDSCYDTFISKATTKDVGGCGYQYGFTNNYNGGGISFFLDTTGGSLCQKLSTTDVLLTNQWNYLVATYKASTGVVNIYINGVLNKTGSFSGNIETDNQSLVFGRKANLLGYFNGLIDDVRIYNRALSAGEIASLYEYPYQMIWKPRMIFINSLTPISLPMKMIIETTNRKNGIELINRNRDIAIIDRKNDITIN